MDDSKFIGAFIGAIVVAVLFVPLGVFFGWLGGLVLKFFCADLLVKGLNLLFSTHRFTSNDIPLITATLAAFGSFFGKYNATAK